jgi:hypothetical protein
MSEIQWYNDFCEAAYLNKKHSPWLRRREPNQQYANCIIIGCQHSDWWYKDFIGIEFLGKLYFDYHYKYLKEVTAVRLTNTTIVSGLTFSPLDIIIV